MTNPDLAPDIAHNPVLQLAEEPLQSPTAFLEKTSTGTTAPAQTVVITDGNLKQQVRAAVLEFVRRELA